MAKKKTKKIKRYVSGATKYAGGKIVNTRTRKASVKGAQDKIPTVRTPPPWTAKKLKRT